MVAAVEGPLSGKERWGEKRRGEAKENWYVWGGED